MPLSKLAELRRMVEAMTPGEWEVRQGGNFTDFGTAGFIDYCTKHSDSATDLKVGDTNVRLGSRLLKRSRKDATGIVALRNDALNLIDVCEAAGAVARHDWGCCGISEQYHRERMAAIDALRAALEKFGRQG